DGLLAVSHPEVGGGRKSEPGRRGCRGNDCRETRRKFLRRCPLVEPCIRTAPQGPFAVPKWLRRQPLNHVVSVARFICERLELASGIAAAANVDEREHITV